MSSASRVTVLGVGNPIMGDDGVGVELLARLEKSLPDERVEYVYGGISGMDLVPVVQDATRLLVLDAIAGTTPGEVRTVQGDQIPRLLAAKLSPHQVGLLDLLAAARLLGNEPEEIVVVGVTPECVDISVGLSAPVEAALDEAVRQATAVITTWLG
ncbi:MAG: hydrogenase maturation protease [Cellulomonadaceae bacterium]|nr:hydrogenase maturation protease [Cellulomonadaceae bacterium]